MAQQYPPDWDRRRHAVYYRDNYQCQRCGAQGGPNGTAELHAHHITPVSQGGSHDPSNLVTWCAQCHSQEHGRPVGAAAFASQRRDHGWQDKYGTWKMHLLVFALTFYTLGLGNLAFAIYWRIIYAIQPPQS